MTASVWLTSSTYATAARPTNEASCLVWMIVAACERGERCKGIRFVSSPESTCLRRADTASDREPQLAGETVERFDVRHAEEPQRVAIRRAPLESAFDECTREALAGPVRCVL